MKLFVETVDSPLGQIFVAASEKGLVTVDFAENKEVFRSELARRFPGEAIARGGDAAREGARALERYFAGDLAALAGLACDLRGTPFQRRVWEALCAIPPGETMTYSALAAAIGRPRAVRAVGGANARNPIALVVPCHRVIGAGGDLTGYASGLERKRWLLAHEAAGTPPPPARRCPAPRSQCQEAEARAS